ncbi:MAG TPA: hypothetical protein VF757_09420 [Sphingomicrobium sp.]
MGAPVSKIEAAEETTAEELLSALKHIEAGERRKHASMYNYWLAIRRGGQLPPIRDLDPLEITDAAPLGVLLELVDGGEDAEILHVGETLRSHVAVKKLSEAPDPSVLSCIAGKVGIVRISRNALAFEDHFLDIDGTTRCSITLLPFSMSGDTVDFIYCLVSVETGVTFSEEEPVAVVEEPTAPEAVTEEAEAPVESVAEEAEPVAAAEPEMVQEPEPAADEAPVEATPNASDDMELPKFLTDPEPTAGPDAKPGFSKIFDALAGAKGFFGTVAPSEPDVPPTNDSDETEFAIEEPEALTPEAEEPEPVTEELVAVPEEPEALAEQPVADAVDEEIEEPAAPELENVQEPRSMEGTLQTKLTEVRSKADEARAARLRSEALIVEGLSAAYDFALDAEDAPEEYLRLVEGQGLKIQLRSPMKPVVKLAFDGYVDDETIKELEAVLAWALKSDLPRGTLAERIEAEGGISAIANGQKARRATDA